MEGPADGVEVKTGTGRATGWCAASRAGCAGARELGSSRAARNRSGVRVGMVESIARRVARGSSRAWKQGLLQAGCFDCRSHFRSLVYPLLSSQPRSGCSLSSTCQDGGNRRNESEGNSGRAPGRAAGLVCLLAMLLLSGCGSFFSKSTTTTTTTTTTSSGSTASDSLYVANANTSLDTVAGYALSSGSLTATTSSPYQLGAVPSTLAITPGNSILYAGSELGGIYGYTIGSAGALTLVGTGAISNVGASAMAVDATGQYLLVLEVGTTNPTLSSFPINTSTGALSSAVSTVSLDAGAAVAMVQVPNTSLVYVTLGTGGVDALTLDSSTGVLTKLSILLSPRGSAYSDNGVASDPAGQYLFVSETGTNGIRSFTVNSSGTLTELSGSPIAAGAGVGAVMVDRTGAFVYAVNQAGNTISAYTLASTGALTAVTGSPFATGATPHALAEDSSKSYLAVACVGGSPDLQLFTIGATGALVSETTQSTGKVSPAGAIALVASY